MDAEDKQIISADRRSRAAGMLLLSTVFWGLSFPVNKAVVLLNGSLAPGGGALFVVSWAIAPRFLLALAFLLLLPMASGRRPTAPELKQGAILGLLSAGGMLFQNDGLRFTSASTSAFLTQFYVILIPIWVGLRSGRSPGPFIWSNCILVLAGAAILGRFDWTHLRLGRGEAESVLSSVFYTAQILVLESRAFAGNKPERVTVAMFASEALLFTAVSAATCPGIGALAAPWTNPSWLALTLVLAVFCTLAAFLIMNAWQPEVTAEEAGLIYCVEPIFCAIFALFVPAFASRWSGIAYANETATRYLVTGGALITLANVLVQLRPRLARLRSAPMRPR